MAKSITFEYEGENYILEFNRRSAEKLEKMGLSLSEVESKPMTMLPLFFYGAFLMHHPMVSREKTDKILAEIHDTTGLIGKLGEMYNETVTTLFSEDAGGEKNVRWTASW